MRVRIKVCGFTRAEDVTAAAVAGIDAFGFNLARGPRRIEVDRARVLVRQVPAFGVSVALFVNADEESVCTAMAATRCAVAQLHGHEPPELAQALGRRFPVVKAFRIRSAADLDAAEGYPADAYLLDAWSAGAHGGTGVTWDHRLLQSRRWSRPLILAGGLGPENAAEAINVVRPQAIDVASGVEIEPGIKDQARVAALVKAVEGA